MDTCGKYLRKGRTTVIICLVSQTHMQVPLKCKKSGLEIPTLRVVLLRNPFLEVVDKRTQFLGNGKTGAVFLHAFKSLI